MPIFMSWDDTLVKGTVEAKGYENWVALETATYSVSRPNFIEPGTGGDARQIDQPMPQQIFISKKFDLASAGLMNFLVKSTLGKDVQFHFVDLEDGTPKLREKWTAVEVFVTSYGVAFDPSGGSESLSLCFGMMEKEFVHVGAGGSESKHHGSWSNTEGISGIK